MPVFFIIIVSLVIALNLRLMYINKKSDRAENLQKYISEDYHANFARARNIDEEMFIRLTENDFPFRDYSGADEKDLLKIQKKVKLCLEAPLIKTGIPTNTEVKKRFGASNLQTVIDGEENYTRLLQNLNRWAKLLAERGNNKDAELILEKAVFINSDLSETYILLYKLYDKTGRATKKIELTQKVLDLPEVTKTLVMNYINGRGTQ